VSSSLPVDFFDLNGGTPHVQNAVSNSTSVAPVQEDVDESVNMEVNDDEEVSSQAQNRSETLPEGFFDDPIMDAKVHSIFLQ